MMKRFVTLPAAILAGGALLLTGCSAGNTDAGAEGLQVVATTTQLGDFTRNVIGDVPGVVTQLADPNQSLHGFDPSAGDLVAIGKADALIVNGGGLDSWVEDAVDASGFKGIVVDTSENIDLDVVPEGAVHEHAHEGADDEHAGETAEEHAEHADEEPSEAVDEHAGESADEHAAHAGESGDPHIWHNVDNAITQVETITGALIAANPAQQSEFEANSAAYLAQLNELNAWIHENVDQVPADQRLLVTSHDAFGHLVSALGITYVGAVIPSTDDSAEASAAQLDELIAKVKDTGVKGVFAESSINSAAAETIADETGATVYAGDEALYGDSLGVSGSAGETYVGSMIHNVSLLLESWGATPSALPANLSK